MQIELHGAHSSLSGLRPEHVYVQRINCVNNVPKTNNKVIIS
jgi:hypothetical protein